MARSTTSDELLKNSSLYREFLAEREEVVAHKWVLSETAGADVGFEEALTDWMINHRTDWRKQRQILRRRNDLKFTAL